ncbi:MAG: hypothetical protein ACOCYG_09305 [Spirochaetota bacterium]
MARTPVSICNQALGRIGAEYISSLQEASSNARHCNTVYEDTVLELLESENWAFAMKRAKPVPVADDTLYEGWDYAYAVPGDMVRLVDIVSSKKVKRKHEGRVLLCNVENPVLVYVSNPSSPEVYTPLFASALALRLATKLAGPVKNSRQLEQSLFQEFYEIYRRARMQEVDESYAEDETGFWVDRGGSLEDIMDRIDNG